MTDKQNYTLESRKSPWLLFIILCIVILVFITVLYLFITKTIHQPERPDYLLGYDQEIVDLIESAESDPSAQFIKETTDMLDPTQAIYDNSVSLSCLLHDGLEFNVGAIPTAENTTNGLYLNPNVTVTEKNKNHIYGVYIDANTLGMSYPDEQIDNTERQQGTTYCLLGRTYDSIADVSKIRWNHDQILEGNKFDFVEFSFRIVDITESTIIGTAKCGVTLDGTTFRLSDLHSTDIRETLEYDEMQCNEFIEMAISFLADKQSGILKGVFNEEEDLQKMRTSAIVEHLQWPYFDIMLDKNSKFIRSKTISRLKPIAVSVSSSIGPITVYIASDYELTGSLHLETGYERSGKTEYSEYAAFGYDILSPMTEKSLFVVPSLRDVSDQLQIASLY